MSHASRILHLVDVFTDTVGAGNRAGVVLDADGLDAAAMLRIAAAAGASETAFGFRASDPADHDLEVRYFSRALEQKPRTPTFPNIPTRQRAVC